MLYRGIIKLKFLFQWNQIESAVYRAYSLYSLFMIDHNFRLIRNRLQNSGQVLSIETLPEFVETPEKCYFLFRFDHATNAKVSLYFYGLK